MTGRTDAERAAIVAADQLHKAEHRVEGLRAAIDDVRATRASIGAELDALEANSHALLTELGGETSQDDHLDALAPYEPSPEELAVIDASLPKFSSLRTISLGDEHAFRASLDAYARDELVDLDRDPIAALLPSPEIDAIRTRWSRDTARLSWDRWDYAIVGGAAVLGALLDFALVSVPPDSLWKGVTHRGSPLTRFLREKSDAFVNGDGWPARVQSGLEKWAKVPFDIARNDRGAGIDIDGLRPGMHRIMSPGHDPVLGFIFGVLDLLRGTCTLIDRHGVTHVIANGASASLPIAVLKLIAHLLSDVATPAGLPPPFFTALQKITALTPFAVGSSGEPQSVADLTRWMYGQGYDLRHFATMSVVPLVVESVVRVGFFARNHERVTDPGELSANVSLKRDEMLLAAHAIAASTNALKVYLQGMNPLAINYAVWMSLAASTLRWMRSRGAQDIAVQRELCDGWRAMLHA